MPTASGLVMSRTGAPTPGGADELVHWREQTRMRQSAVPTTCNQVQTRRCHAQSGCTICRQRSSLASMPQRVLPRPQRAEPEPRLNFTGYVLVSREHNLRALLLYRSKSHPNCGHCAQVGRDVEIDIVPWICPAKIHL